MRDELREIVRRARRISSSNGAGHHRPLELCRRFGRRRFGRRPRARDLALALAIAILLSLIPRSCEVNRKPAARIAQAEQQIREHAELESWPADKTERVIARLHQRYIPGEEP